MSTTMGKKQDAPAVTSLSNAYQYPLDEINHKPLWIVFVIAFGIIFFTIQALYDVLMKWAGNAHNEAAERPTREHLDRWLYDFSSVKAANHNSATGNGDDPRSLAVHGETVRWRRPTKMSAPFTPRKLPPREACIY